MRIGKAVHGQKVTGSNVTTKKGKESYWIKSYWTKRLRHLSHPFIKWYGQLGIFSDELL